MKTYDVAPIVVSDESENISDLLANRVQKTPNLPLFAIESSPGQWADVSAKAFEDQVISVAKGLIAAGIQPGQAVGIMSRTRYEWTVLDFAIWFAGAVSVPIYESSSAKQMEWILSDSDSVALFLETEEHQERFESINAFLRLIVAHLECPDMVHLTWSRLVTPLLDASRTISAKSRWMRSSFVSSG